MKTNKKVGTENLPYAYLNCCPEELELGAVILAKVHENHPLSYVLPFDKEEERSISEKEARLTNENCQVMVTFLSPVSMTSFDFLMDLLVSQVERTALPLVPVVTAAVPLGNDQEFLDFREKQTDIIPLSPEEQENLLIKLEKVQKHFQRDSNYANFRGETLVELAAFLEEKTTILTKGFCFTLCKELVNSLHCNFIFQPHYSDSTLPQLYRDLATRLRNSTLGGHMPFLQADFIHQKEERHFFSQYPGLNLSEFYRSQSQDLQLEGRILRHFSSQESKVVVAFSVREIGANAFAYLEQLEELVLPDGVQKLGDYAFDCCTRLKRVYFPPSLREIGDSAFVNCENLLEIVLPEGVERVGRRCFSQCTGLKKITLPDSLLMLGEGAFEYCSALEEVILSKNLTEIPANCFQYCTELQNLTLPEGISSVGQGAFVGSGVDGNRKV